VIGHSQTCLQFNARYCVQPRLSLLGTLCASSPKTTPETAFTQSSNITFRGLHAAAHRGRRTTRKQQVSAVSITFLVTDFFGYCCHCTHHTALTSLIDTVSEVLCILLHVRIHTIPAAWQNSHQIMSHVVILKLCDKALIS
jgi:hypothetical protein